MSMNDFKDDQIIEEELLFLDMPELSRFEIFDGMNTSIENMAIDKTGETANFELNITPIQDPEGLMKLKFQGKSVQTLGTCMFFIRKDNKFNVDDDIKIINNLETDINESNINSKKEEFKIEYVGKCNKVTQAFLVD